MRRHPRHHCRQSLLEVPAGETVRVESLAGDGPTRSRLYSLGFTPGTEVHICPECACSGARRVRVRNSSLVLGESMARCVRCVAATRSGLLTRLRRHWLWGRQERAKA